MSALVAVDLDQTLIYSERSAGLPDPPPAVHVVETYLGGRSVLTVRAGELAADLASRHDLLPVTTRTAEQYQRLRLPFPTPSALCGNGGVLLVDGRRSAGWDAWAASVAARSTRLADAEQLFAAVAEQDWVRTWRTAEGLFCYLVAHRREDVPAGWLSDLAGWAAANRWRVSVQGRKVYAVPEGLSKAAAVLRLADHVGASALLAAGDSLLDADLLNAADAAIRPAHGELHHADPPPAGARSWAVTPRSGALAAEDLLLWLTERADQPRGVRRTELPVVTR